MADQSRGAGERIFVGTCGYSYPGEPPNGWHGVFYPTPGKKLVGELEYYSMYFGAVEINSTFYRPPNAQMAQGWLKKTPSDFIFAVKAWQKFTHAAKLGTEANGEHERWERFDSDDVQRFSEGIAPLSEAGRLGALLFQYPAKFVCNPENIERLEAALSAFDFCPKVVELRHRSWSDRQDEIRARLAGFSAAWAFIDEPKFSTSVKQELTARGDVSYLRLRGRNQQKWWKHEDAWERYDYIYQADSIRRLAERLKKLQAGSPKTKFYVFFNNHARGQAVANALMLQAALVPSSRVQAPRALVEAFPELQSFVVHSEAREFDSPSA
jgi:uncharacterized protein YecE (DUF72 family)